MAVKGHKKQHHRNLGLLMLLFLSWIKKRSLWGSFFFSSE